MRQAAEDQPTVVLTGVSSDSHTWNLVFLQLLIEEHGHRVINLGPCVPPDLLVAECRMIDPDLVVVSTVNGHGGIDGLAAITALRAEPCLIHTPVVIGGKLGVDGASAPTDRARLRNAGYSAVFGDGDDLPAFASLLLSLRSRVAA
ncbi:MAG TPA: cobalamin-dependent protein [Microlunatus sp.]